MDVTAGVLQRGAQVIGALLLYAAILFISSGRLDWPAAWIYLAISTAVILVNSTILLSKNPAFIAARAQLGQESKVWDKQVTALAGVFMILGLVTPGLDLRFGWSMHFPGHTQVVGFIALALGYALFSWAMISNEFFETKVRIQTDRGQTVETGGPYRFVRHPGYIGMILQLLGTPIALGSWWGVIPAACAAIVFVVRTTLEDRALRAELPGYAEYAKRVVYRLLPGVW
jgi:protein-S-isoprenylcysteine O-methyltransferase Ste14